LVLGFLVAGFVVSMQLPADAQASTTAGSGCQVVHIGPSIAAGAPSSSYFNLSAAPGTTMVEKMVVANPNPYSCGVTLSAAYGTTAVNGGDSYTMVGPGQPCVGPACWLEGLPQTVTVPTHDRVLVPFTIKVPGTVASGQYLAGVIGQSSTPPAAPRVPRSSGQVGSVGASIVDRVAIGLAITVPGALRPKLVISSVQVVSGGLVANSIDMTVRNTGNTWVHPKGTVSVALPPWNREGISCGTVLPGNTALLSAPEQSIPGGPHLVAITLNYADGVPPATWQGYLSFPQPAVVHVRGGTITVVVSAGLPEWAEILLIGLGAAVFVLAGLLFFWRRRRPRDDAQGGLDQRPPPGSDALLPPPAGYPPTSPSGQHGVMQVVAAAPLGGGNDASVPGPLASSPQSGLTGSSGPTNGR